MKYLKVYKFFESIEPDYDRISNDVRNCFLDITDYGFEVSVDIEPSGPDKPAEFVFMGSEGAVFMGSEGAVDILSHKFNGCIKISNDECYFKIDKISETLLFAVSYLKSEFDFNIKDIEILTNVGWHKDIKSIEELCGDNICRGNTLLIKVYIYFTERKDS